MHRAVRPAHYFAVCRADRPASSRAKRLSRDILLLLSQLSGCSLNAQCSICCKEFEQWKLYTIFHVSLIVFIALWNTKNKTMKCKTLQINFCLCHNDCIIQLYSNKTELSAAERCRSYQKLMCAFTAWIHNCNISINFDINVCTVHNIQKL